MSQYASDALVMIFMDAPKIIGGQRFPRRNVSELHAYARVVTTATAYVAVGYTLICQISYLGFVLRLRYCAKTGAAADPPLLKVM